jgi:UDP-glucuronate 4-epimerase
MNFFNDNIEHEKKILVTGCAGFIGSHVCEYLCNNNYFVLGIDNLNDYYNVNLKLKNIDILNKFTNNFKFVKDDIINTTIIQEWKPYKIIHLASMAGVRYSLENPKLYFDVNVNGFINILEQSVKNNVKQIIYASSSSVYGLNTKVPFSENDQISSCNSPYACSKMTMELIAKTYNQLYNINSIGLRFFTVYGPRGRPDMAPFKFLNAIINENKFNKFGDGSSSRDYTYIDDIVQGIINSLENKNNIECEVYNLGNSNPVSLNEFINTCENVCNKKALFIQCDEQLGDVPKTYADITKAKKDLNYNPKTNLLTGLTKTYQHLIS